MQPPSAAGKPASRWMIMAFWLALLLFLAWMFQWQLERRYNPNRSLALDSQQVVLKRNAGGHYLAPGQVNGKQALFIVDTGATDVVVPGQLADRFGLRRGAQITSQTANGLTRGWRTEIARLQIGGLDFSGVKAVILPAYRSEELLLGMSLLRQLKLVQSDGTLVLAPPD